MNFLTLELPFSCKFEKLIVKNISLRSFQMETRKHITDKIQEQFKELKEETRLLHSKWR